MPYIKLMRPHHYIKSIVLIFMSLVLSGELLNVRILVLSAWALIVFCMISSAIYVINDISDVERDRRHSRKKNRPIASGKVSVRNAWILAAFLVAVTCVINYLICGGNFWAWACIGLYFGANVAYSRGLKNVPIIDVAILALGYTLRLFYLSSVTGLDLPKWIYLTVMTMALYLGLYKRRNEIKRQTGETREVLKFYNYDFLDKNMYVCYVMTLVFYTLLAVNSHKELVWSVPVLCLAGLKYSLNTENDTSDNPADTLFKDKVLMVLTVLFVGLVIGLIYI